jgi:hypothetical protein
MVSGKLLARRWLLQTLSRLALHWHSGCAAQCEERSVFPLVYAFLVGVIAWAFGRPGGPWILRLSEPGQQRVRLAAAMLATGVSAMGIAVLGLQLGVTTTRMCWAGQSAPR